MIEFPFQTADDIWAYDESVRCTRAILGLPEEQLELRSVPTFVDVNCTLVHHTLSEKIVAKQRCSCRVVRAVWNNPLAKFYPCPCQKVLWVLPPWTHRVADNKATPLSLWQFRGY